MSAPLPEPARFACVTLTTDYGHGSGFVGTLHAVAFRIAPAVRVIDLDNEIPPQDVRLGALRMERFMRVAPAGVHVGVVDPGVGGSRRPVAIEAGSHAFVGPDNGLLTWAAEACARAAGGVDGAGGRGETGKTSAAGESGEAGAAGVRAVVLDRPEYWLEHRSRTFDGRDVFVPVAAHLALGATLDQVGTEIDPASLVRLERPIVRVRGHAEADVEVLQVDGFGNVQLSGDETTVTALGLRVGDRLQLSAGAGAGSSCGLGTYASPNHTQNPPTDTRRAPVEAVYAVTFSDVDEGAAAVLLDSDGCLALSVNRGRADSLLAARNAQQLTIKRL